MKKVCFVSFTAAVSLAVGLFAPGRASADPVIINGSFENQPVAADSSATLTSGYGWVRSFNGPVVVVNGNLVDQNGDNYGVTPYGSQYLGMDKRSQGFVSRASQTIPGFVLGQTYTLTLYVADSDNGTSPILDINFNNGSSTTYFDQIYNVPVSGPYGDVIQFNQVTATFTSPITGSMTLSLSNNSAYPGPPASISIDNVSIATVPEPTTLAGVLLGTSALVGGMVRRKQRG